MNIFYCLEFETSLTLRARSPYLYPPGTGWPSYTFRHWVPFSSPPTTRMATVEVFEPASSRSCTILSLNIVCFEHSANTARRTEDRTLIVTAKRQRRRPMLSCRGKHFGAFAALIFLYMRRQLQMIFSAYFPYFEKNRSRLMRSPCAVSACVTLPLLGISSVNTLSWKRIHVQ
jgi:hypothetical protein